MKQKVKDEKRKRDLMLLEAQTKKLQDYQNQRSNELQFVNTLKKEIEDEKSLLRLRRMNTFSFSFFLFSDIKKWGFCCCHKLPCPRVVGTEIENEQAQVGKGKEV